MQDLEVSGAVRHIYVIRRLKVKGRSSQLLARAPYKISPKETCYDLWLTFNPSEYSVFMGLCTS